MATNDGASFAITIQGDLIRAQKQIDSLTASLQRAALAGESMNQAVAGAARDKAASGASETKTGQQLAQAAEARLKAQEDMLAAQKKAGLINDWQERESSLQYRAQTRVLLENARTQAVKDQSKAPDPVAAQDEINSLNERIKLLERGEGLFASTFREGLNSGLNTALKGLAQGTLDRDGAMQAVAASLSNTLLDMAVKNVSTSLSGGVMDMFGSIGGLFGLSADPSAAPTNAVGSAASVVGGTASGGGFFGSLLGGLGSLFGLTAGGAMGGSTPAGPTDISSGASLLSMAASQLAMAGSSLVTGATAISGAAASLGAAMGSQGLSGAIGQGNDSGMQGMEGIFGGILDQGPQAIGMVQRTASAQQSAINTVTAAQTAADATMTASAATAAATNTATQTAAATASTAAWTPAATMASIGSFGGAAAIGLAAVIAALAFRAFANGGQVRGPGTTTSDSIPALLSDQEFVTRASVVQQPGALPFLQDFNRYGMSALSDWAWRSSVRHATGGMAGTPAPVMPQPSLSGIRSAEPIRNMSATLTNQQDFYLIDDPQRIADVFNSPRGSDAMAVVISKDPARFRAVLGLKG